jgi:hypothetical protein
MTEPRPLRPLDLAFLLLILAVGVAARGWYLQECADGGHNSGPLQVQDTSDPKAEPIHGYRWLLAQSQQFTDHERIVRWTQVGLGALTGALWFLFARRAFRSQAVAVLTGFFCALHPQWVVNPAQLEDGVLAAFALGLVAWLGVRGGQSGGPLTSLLFGLSLAGLALVRPTLLPFSLFAVLWFLWRCRSLPRGWQYALLAFLGFANALVPSAVRNYQTTHEVLPLTSIWREVWIGNHPGATGGPEGQPPGDASAATLAHEVVEEVRRAPTTTLNRRLWAGASFVFGEEWLRQPGYWPESDPANPLPPWFAGSYRTAVAGTLLAMLLLGFIGWRWSAAWRSQSLPAALAMILIPLPYILTHADKLIGPRLPLDGLLLCYAAFTLVGILPGVGERLRRGTDSSAEPGSGLHPV